MAEDEWVDVSAAPLLADERWLHAVSSNGAAEPITEAPRLRIVTLGEFVSVEEVTAEPLLGSKTETLLPADGMLLMYGDGGAGKTTLSLDGVFHLCSGRSWLGLEVGRCLKVLVIENEGPRGKFRQMLAEKQEAWGAPIGEQLVVLEEPWTQFTLQADEHRSALAEYVSAFAVDVVVMGPLVTLGMIGGGTPDEVSAFESLIADTRQRCEKAFALWIVHHENKAGDVSGAWERVPDTLVHIQAQGNGHTRLVWRKARWSSEHHGTSLELVWSDGRSFETVEKKARDPWEEMVVAFTHANGWRTVKESARLIAISEGDAKKVLAELVRRGEMEYEQGPPGRHGSAHCYRLKGALADSAHLDAPSENLTDEEQGARLRSPVRGAAARSAPAPSSEAAPKEVSAPSAASPADDDGIPF